jgi:anti-sigma regulatory factor (Ser/Thr protein kinase)
MTPAASPRAAVLTPIAVREQVLPAHADQVKVARAFIAAVLAACPAVGDAVLCVSELATNAVLHSASRNPGGTFTVRAAIFDDHVRVEVEDNGGRWEERPDRDSRPHGLDIVRELAADCGRDGGPLTGWVAWAQLQRCRT